jgi:hypothetical protein
MHIHNDYAKTTVVEKIRGENEASEERTNNVNELVLQGFAELVIILIEVILESLALNTLLVNLLESISEARENGLSVGLKGIPVRLRHGLLVNIHGETLGAGVNFRQGTLNLIGERSHGGVLSLQLAEINETLTLHKVGTLGEELSKSRGSSAKLGNDSGGHSSRSRRTMSFCEYENQKAQV